MATALPKKKFSWDVPVSVALVCVGALLLLLAGYGILFYLPLLSTYSLLFTLGFFLSGALGAALLLWGLMRFSYASKRAQEAERKIYEYCTKCGHNLYEKPPQFHCRKCRKLLDPGTLHCGYCGHPTQQPVEVPNGMVNTNPSLPVAQKTVNLNDAFQAE